MHALTKGHVSAAPTGGSSLPSANPFQRLAALLEGIDPGSDSIVMTIGEPRHAIPAFVGEVLAENLADFRRYPPIEGTPEFRAGVADWLDRRYRLGGTIDRKSGVLPLNGSREGLSFSAIAARDQLGKTGAKPAVLFPNPFYQTYAAAAHIAGADAILLDAKPENGFLPDLDSLDPDLLDRTVAFIYASPTNPEGAVASLETWQKLIGLARRHDFFIFADECYSEIYRDTPPPGVLEAAHAMGGGYEKVITLNSLSKRSNLAGLRCGFAAGDPEFLAKWVKFRGLAAPQVPLPAQAVAVRAFGDEAHVIENRRLYNEKFAIADELLAPVMGGPVSTPAGFFLWLDVSRWGGGLKVTRDLWEKTGVKVLPGSYLALEGGEGNPGDAFVRVALVEEAGVVRKGLTRIADYLGVTR
ncbi:aminotransferase class I/II-fold pyridoxal phosphate-dependent enzyme [Stappia sp. F7233]|uniref:Aminotransferase class I/II-fold pyridoxal phosphate-dependent enzyme n=1 Tax=Stappia albiluteola TaxID=2758565 RepID=A0A839AG30_9HYPH|nr:aminotransferase class I/II-fold pyridoxal phosphate-dependent enzyme [Stappia albiluteola]MBA5778621.1 aminotransferase class I/II-fold pyridoxal phosphate-dependent enzyme [Stappia albiluteola]